MAKSGERRMVFDVRGRRKHVIRITYAILAVLMGASLFLVVGPLNVGELIGGGSSRSTSSVLEEQAENMERRLAKRPHDEQLLLALARTRYAAGNALVEVDPATRKQTVTPEAKAEYEKAAEAWSRYLKLAGAEATSSTALLMANTYFILAQNATTLEESESAVGKAAEAQQIVAEDRPSIGSLSTLAIYEYFAGDFAAGDKAAREAVQRAPKATAQNAKKQLADYRKRGKQFEKQKQKFAKEAKKVGKEKLENPFGSFGAAPTGP